MSVMGTCPTCGDETADSCCTACMAERIRKLEAHLATAMDALQFAEGAIIDAVAHKDGLDGAAGYAVLQIIWTELKKHGCGDKRNRVRGQGPMLRRRTGRERSGRGKRKEKRCLQSRDGLNLGTPGSTGRSGWRRRTGSCLRRLANSESDSWKRTMRVPTARLRIRWRC